jgi:TrmH family RNA methyltransferase
MNLITSVSNNTIKLVRKLLDDKKYRDATNMFCAETNKIVVHLINSQYKVKFIIVSKKSKFLNDFNKYITYTVEDSVFLSLSSLSTPDGIIGVFEKRNSELFFEKNKKYYVLDKIQNPTNLGTISRSCLAFGIDGLIILNGSVDIYNPVVIRSSMGAIFNLPIKFITDFKVIRDKLKSLEYTIYGTALTNKTVALNKIKFPNSCAIVLGNEGNGISKAILTLCDEIIYIPIDKKIDSLSVSATAAIIG